MLHSPIDWSTDDFIAACGVWRWDLVGGGFLRVWCGRFGLVSGSYCFCLFHFWPPWIELLSSFRTFQLYCFCLEVANPGRLSQNKPLFFLVAAVGYFVSVMGTCLIQPTFFLTVLHSSVTSGPACWSAWSWMSWLLTVQRKRLGVGRSDPKLVRTGNFW